MQAIFENDAFKTINVFSKEYLKAIYDSAGAGTVYEILKQTSIAAVGDASTIEAQAAALMREMGSTGMLGENGNHFILSVCYDANNKVIGIQLDEKGKGTVIEPPKGTVYKSEYTNTGTYIDEAKMAEPFGEERYNNLSDYEEKQAADLKISRTSPEFNRHFQSNLCF